MFVCHCKVVNDQVVNAAIASGARSVAEVTNLCTAGGGCGGCHTMLQAMIDAVETREPVGATAA